MESNARVELRHELYLHLVCITHFWFSYLHVLHIRMIWRIIKILSDASSGVACVVPVVPAGRLWSPNDQNEK